MIRSALLPLLCISLSLAADPAIIGHPDMPPIDAKTLQRIYTGKVVEVNGTRVTPIDLPPGNPLRLDFLRTYLHQDDESYIGYWTVRRYIGKGSPPRQFKSPAEVARFVAHNKGSIGYVDPDELSADVTVLLQAP